MPKQRAGTTYYSVTELADMLGVHRNTVVDWINRGLIEAVRFGLRPKSPFMIPESEVKRVADQVDLPM